MTTYLLDHGLIIHIELDPVTYLKTITYQLCSKNVHLSFSFAGMLQNVPSCFTLSEQAKIIPWRDNLPIQILSCKANDDNDDTVNPSGRVNWPNLKINVFFYIWFITSLPHSICRIAVCFAYRRVITWDSQGHCVRICVKRAQWTKVSLSGRGLAT